MVDIWNSLIETCDFFIEQLDKSGIEYNESNMKRFNQNGWINRTWQSHLYRRAHIDVVDARESKGLWMMHCCIFPQFTNDAPIFGFDVIAGKSKITGCFIDYSPTVKKNHFLLNYFYNMVNTHRWNKERDLPDWAKNIFSEDIVAVSNIKTQDELDRIIMLAKDSIVCYINGLKKGSFVNNVENIMEAHEYYAINQKQNPHILRIMMALGLEKTDVDFFINHCLFPSIK